MAISRPYRNSKPSSKGQDDTSLLLKVTRGEDLPAADMIGAIHRHGQKADHYQSLRREKDAAVSGVSILGVERQITLDMIEVERPLM